MIIDVCHRRYSRLSWARHITFAHFADKGILSTRAKPFLCIMSLDGADRERPVHHSHVMACSIERLNRFIPWQEFIRALREYDTSETTCQHAGDVDTPCIGDKLPSASTYPMKAYSPYPCCVLCLCMQREPVFTDTPCAQMTHLVDIRHAIIPDIELLRRNSDGGLSITSVASEIVRQRCAIENIASDESCVSFLRLCAYLMGPYAYCWVRLMCDPDCRIKYLLQTAAMRQACRIACGITLAIDVRKTKQLHRAIRSKLKSLITTGRWPSPVHVPDKFATIVDARDPCNEQEITNSLLRLHALHTQDHMEIFRLAKKRLRRGYATRVEEAAKFPPIDHVETCDEFFPVPPSEVASLLDAVTTTSLKHKRKVLIDIVDKTLADIGKHLCVAPYYADAASVSLEENTRRAQPLVYLCAECGIIIPERIQSHLPVVPALLAGFDDNAPVWMCDKYHVLTAQDVTNKYIGGMVRMSVKTRIEYVPTILVACVECSAICYARDTYRDTRGYHCHPVCHVGI
jgi:hypothetical protein